MKIAFVFPGQGSQSVGMFNGFGANATVRAVVDDASQAIGTNLWQLAEAGPAEELGLTTNTQPIMLAGGAAYFQAWRARGGVMPDVVAGHSLGEYTALVAAGSLNVAQAAALVRFRADAMQTAVPVGVGAMAAVMGLDAERVRAVCAESSQGQVVEAVNYNEPAQTVIAGHKEAVERAGVAAKAAGAKRALPLPVSAPFHSSLMKPAADRLAERLANEVVAAPACAVINNVDVAIETDPARIKDALVRQACNAVRWVETVQRMQAMGITHLVECGPGKVLAGLAKRIAPEIVALNINDQASLDAALEALR